ncbi:ABC transporter ATP-binding protein [Cellulomonas triticagri]|uniref:ATP-binding cassette domain-containing protein n=1 Tax=Cellulomonas triticagri TaxID=2483352 RepID=A0A3M2JLN9_9CELL|nr:ATP-binding cassette domain-containing protein [Cellulomonas triticagri]RMI12740.1 ATP-binding cassette domain-containing protein [Cellulomonas triticagri]
MSGGLELRGVHVTLGGRHVLDGVDLDLAPVGSVAVVGPSGSGKTTLLAVVAGLLAPDAGTVLRGGRPVDARDVAWVMQTTPLLGARSAVDNVALGALARGCTRAAADAVARDALDGLGLGDRAGTRVRRLSGGERQRVAVARALVQEAPVVVADEPTASLDAHARDRVVQALLAVASAGRLVLVATHDRVVADGCDRVVDLVAGRPA